MGSGGSSAGISAAKAVVAVKEGAKTGDMPSFQIGLSNVKGINKIYEAVDKNFDYPSDEYLRRQGVRGLNDGWSYNQDSNTMTREFYITTKNGGLKYGGVTMPAGTTREARSGAEKEALYKLLKRADKLDKNQFIKKG